MEPTVQPPIITQSAQTPPPRKKGRLLVMALISLLLVLVASALFFVHRRNSSQKSANTTVTAETIPPAAQVTISATGFSPATVKIKKGQSVNWVNEDTNPHQVASDPYPTENGLDGFREQEPLDTRQSYSFSFEQSGTYSYHDHLNPLQLKATVIVE